MKEKKHSLWLLMLTFFIGVIITLGIVYFFYIDKIDKKTITENKNVTVSENDTLKSSIEKIYNAVYVIQTYDKSGNLSGSGTGFVYKKDDKVGYILTNSHVISGASTIKLTNTEGETVDGIVLGNDEYSDIAVLSIPVDNVLQIAEIGDSTKATIGDTVFTVGSPLGIKYMGTVTKGILSGKNREVTVSINNSSMVMDVLQTDAAINPGNSGGPLLNINGQVIGINSMKLVEDEIEGMGFALPIEFVMTYVDQLEKGQKIERPMLGVQMVDATSSRALASYGINLNSDIKSGVVVIEVQQGTPAADSGLQKGDVIIKLNDTNVSDSARLKSVLYKCRIGDTIRLTIIRDGKEREIKVKLDKSLES